MRRALTLVVDRASRELLAVTLLVGITGVCPAQEPPPAKAPSAADRVEERLALFKERLKLSPEQAEKIRPILQEEAEKLKAVRAQHEAAGASGDRRVTFKELRLIQQDTRDRINPILTPEQQSEWAKMREESRERARQHYRGKS